MAEYLYDKDAFEHDILRPDHDHLNGQTYIFSCVVLTRTFILRMHS